jgi:iron complex outermembrane recepter protein
MKKVLSVMLTLALFNVGKAQTSLTDTSTLQPVEVQAVKATEKNPFAKTNLTKQKIQQQNIGQDLPFIIHNTPSVVANSDAGNGIGYTNLRIRGTDATRINVTINGIPYNDAESLGTFLVNIPDIASSANNIQIQRGVGTSANGAGSFGGSINLSTNEIVKQKNFEFNNSFGSFGSMKNTLLYNSGLFKKYFTVDARLSNIRSDGYVDRASSKLNSGFLSASFAKANTTLRANIITGSEKTYQAYYGLPFDSLKTNRTYNSAGTEKPGDPYANQTDNYKQTHYQFFATHKFSKAIKANLTGFFTKGKGYYEQYKVDADLADYKLVHPTLTSTDVVRQLWLDNNFYGATWAVNFERKNTQLIFGGGINQYDGKHFGIVEWTKDAVTKPANNKYYDLDAVKKDKSAYLKWTQKLGKYWESFVDLQARNVKYTINGFRNNPTLFVNSNFSFFNPKAGITFNKNGYKAYASYGKASKEPVRDDFENNPNKKPVPETLHDIEIGFEMTKKNYQIGINGYHMQYKNQLILVGNINDVGAYTRTNIDDSYRTGVELFGGYTINKFVSIEANTTFSSNKIRNYNFIIDDYDTGGTITEKYKKTSIAFSPNSMATFIVNYNPLANLQFTATSKFVGKQFLDNTQNSKKQLESYFTQDARVAYTIKPKIIKQIQFFADVKNVFSKLYSPNGYTVTYKSGGTQVFDNYHFPMAPINFMVGIHAALF